MHDNGKGLFFFLLIISLITIGCAGTPKVLKQEDVQNIKRLAVVTSLKDNNLQILDRTGAKERTYGGYQFGALGAALESLILSGIASSKVKSSLGGDPELLKKELVNFPAKILFDEYFVKTFTMNFEIVNPQDIDKLGIKEYPEKETSDEKTVKDYTIIKEKFGTDTILEINFIYGLAAYESENASVVISADVSVIDVKDNKLLMKKNILSDEYFKMGHTIDEFRANNAELFKKELIEAICGCAHLITSDFGEKLRLKDRSYWRTKQ
jgi:hypothetical protein